MVLSIIDISNKYDPAVASVALWFCLGTILSLGKIKLTKKSVTYFIRNLNVNINKKKKAAHKQERTIVSVVDLPWAVSKV